MEIVTLHWDNVANIELVNLCDGKLKFPNLKYNGGLDPIAPSSRLSKSLRAICSNLRKKGFNDAVNIFARLNKIDELNHIQMAQLHTELSATISAKITAIKDGGEYDEDSLCEVFHLIQLWGGNTGRNIYLKNGGFAANWCYESYKKIAQICIGAQGSEIYNTIPALDRHLKKIQNWGLAFASKHYSFWNAAGADHHLAIFDSVLCNGLFGVKTPNSRMYLEYLKKLVLYKQQHTTPIQNIERKLFNYFQSVEGAVWIAVRMRDDEEV
jgi:hypothetical protein